MKRRRRAGPEKSGTNPWRVARQFLREVPKGRTLSLMVVGLGLLATLLMVVNVLLLSRALMLVFLRHADWAEIAPLLWWGMAVVVARALAVYESRAVGAELHYRMKRGLRERLLRFAFQEGSVLGRDQATGAQVSTLLEAAESVGVLVSRYLPQVMLAAAAPVIVLLVVGREFWVAGIILLVTAPLIPVFMVLIGRAAEGETKRQWQALARLSGHFLDVLGGLPTLILFNQTQRQREIIGRVSENYREAVMRVLRLALLSALVLELFAAIAMALVAVAVGLALMSGTVTLAPALAVLILAPEFYAPQRALGSAFHQAMEGVTAADALLDVWERGQRRPMGGVERPAGAGPWEVALEAVTATYPDRGDPLGPYMVFVRPGEHVAVVGPSGAGKTTLLHLLLGYLPPSGGRVTVGGVDLAGLDLSWWRSQVGYVGQWPYFSFGSIRDNLTAARPDADDALLWSALQAAQIGDFVAGLPYQLDAPIGDRGYRLSGGQAGRLALARLFLREVPVVLLDEPTEYLDPVGRSAVWDALDKYLRGRTLLLVTHRREEAERADRVVTVVGPTDREALGEGPLALVSP